MSRQVEIDASSVQYVNDLGKKYKCTVGLLIGQAVGKNFVLIHLARTVKFIEQKSINDINVDLIDEHAREVCQMLPGGMQVLGIFVVGDEDIFGPTVFNNKIKSILNIVNMYCTCTRLNKKMESFPTDDYLSFQNISEKLVLHYSSKTEKCVMKTFNTASSDLQNITLKTISNKSNKWIRFDYTYHIDYTHYFGKNPNERADEERKEFSPKTFNKSGATKNEFNRADIALEQHSKTILSAIETKLKWSLFFYDNAFVSDDEVIESLRKKPRAKSKGQNKNSNNDKDINDIPVQVVIVEGCASNTSKDFGLETINERIKILGDLVCKLWLNSKLTIADARIAIIEEIMRSLSARIRMHLDSLTEEELEEECNSVHGLPRRVLFKIPQNEINMSAYLFPGESIDGVSALVEELLDINQNIPITDLLECEQDADIDQGCEANESFTKQPARNNSFFNEFLQELILVFRNPLNYYSIRYLISVLIGIIAIFYYLFFC